MNFADKIVPTPGPAKRRSARACRWIEKHCRVPTGPDRGQFVRLSRTQQQTLREIYDVSDAPRSVLVTDRHLAAYLALLHVVGPEAIISKTLPVLDVDLFSVWSAAASPELRRVLKRTPDGVICPQLRTRYPAAA